ncbi:hypothetical protein VNO77_14394 [Canavalia gladiata]|uniref:K+ potassium transporter integral membrane domain-containing protein n=1 Tax=Canavalia gladiata TaxID=3824 RepID=A0AAN9M3G2_CANGL
MESAISMLRAQILGGILNIGELAVGILAPHGNRNKGSEKMDPSFNIEVESTIVTVTATTVVETDELLLCKIGFEIMFADLGHFSYKAIQTTFTLLVYPALQLVHMGQAACMSCHHDSEL